MAQKAYIGINNIARRGKKLYVGVNGKARKVKKAYIGIAGKARQFFTAERELVKLSNPTGLSVAREYATATSVGNYALFGGGDVGTTSSPKNTVDAYNTSLTRSTPTALSKARTNLNSNKVGNYALFGGGDSSDSSLNTTYYSTVDAYNTSLTRSTPTALSKARRQLGASSVGNYALFGGGYAAPSSSYSVGSDVVDTVDAYNTSLTRSTPTALSKARANLNSNKVGKYALFSGGNAASGYDSNYVTTVDAYNTSLTRSTPTALSKARGGCLCASVGNYALFGGGYSAASYSSFTYYSTVDAYNTSLTRSNPTTLSKTRAWGGGTNISNTYALFGGGYSSDSSYNSTYYSTVEAYNTSLTRTNPSALQLSVARGYFRASSVGNYALFGGGCSEGGTQYSTVNAYEY